MTDFFGSTLAEGIARGKQGMTAAIEHADRVEPSWSERALEAVREYAPVLYKFTMEQLVEYAHAKGLPKPPDGRAWGSVTQSATRNRIIIPTGEFRRAKTSNGAMKAVYVAVTPLVRT